MRIEVVPIAYVHNKRKETGDDFWGDVVSEITLTEDFSPLALKGLDEFSHAEIIFYFDKADKSETVTKTAHPRGNKNWPLTGIFAMRRKDRPNHLGLSVVKIIEIRGKSIMVSGLDAIDGTPVLDIKPVLREFLPAGEVKQPGWAGELMQNYWKVR